MAASQKTAIVTGAGGGIGRAICAQLAGAGYVICAVGRTKQTLIDALAGAGDQHMFVPADLAEPAAAADVAARVIDRCGHVDLLVNNAARILMQPLEQSSRSDLESMFAVNVYGPTHLIASLWPHFVERGGGAIVNISSMATIDPFPGLSIYAATKAALESITRSIVTEGAAHHIRAWSIAPGAVETDMLRQVVSIDDLPASATLAPEDIAQVVLECATGGRDDDVGRVITVPNR